MPDTAAVSQSSLQRTSLQNSSTPISSVGRDWNGDYQRLISQINNNDEIILDANSEAIFRELSQFFKDFLYTSKTIGRIIISEKYLSDQDKTIKPVAIGGVAGGLKYIAHNIIFKFAVDDRGIYGGDEYAMLAAGELSFLFPF